MFTLHRVFRLGKAVAMRQLGHTRLVVLLCVQGPAGMGWKALTIVTLGSGPLVPLHLLRGSSGAIW